MNIKRLLLTMTVASSSLFFLASNCGARNAGNTPMAQNALDTAPATTVTESNAPDKLSATNTEEHDHKPSIHGGIPVSIGRDSYHAEAVSEQRGVLRLYMLGQDETKGQEVEIQELTAYVKAETDTQAVAVPLLPKPQMSDQPHKTILFLATLPKEHIGKRLEITIPSLRVQGERFRLAFKSNPLLNETEHLMPTKVENDAERQIYLTAGGKYSAADIRANGVVVPSQGNPRARILSPTRTRSYHEKNNVMVNSRVGISP